MESETKTKNRPSQNKLIDPENRLMVTRSGRKRVGKIFKKKEKKMFFCSIGMEKHIAEEQI